MGDAKPSWIDAYEQPDAPMSKPAPRRGPSERKGTKYEKSARTKMRKALGDLVRRTPGFNGDHYAKNVAELLGVPKGEARTEIETMARERLLTKRHETRGGATKGHWNFYPPTLILHGKEVSLAEAVRSAHNVHKLAYNTVRERWLAGLSIEEALAMSPTKTGGVRRAMQNKGSDGGEGDW